MCDCQEIHQPAAHDGSVGKVRSLTAFFSFAESFGVYCIHKMEEPEKDIRYGRGTSDVSSS